MTAVMRDWQDSLREAGLRTYRPETIVVALQGGKDAFSAMPIARVLAAVENATIHLMYAGEALENARQVLDTVGLTAEDVSGAVVDQAPGGLEEIVSAAASAPAPIIVACMEPGEEQASLGELADAVLAKSPSQVLLVSAERGREPWQIKRIVLAHDGSPSADAAISIAADLAHRAGAEVVALHVAARKTEHAAEPGSFPAPRYVDQPQHEWPAWANEFVQRMMALGASARAVNFQLLVAGGQPGSEIAQFARDNCADLVAMAWHGRWETERAGTLKVVARRSGCPVLLICAPPSAGPVLEPATNEERPR